MAGVAPLLAVPHLSDDLARVEHALQEAVRSEDAYLTEVASHLIRAGGKRLRPALALASAATRSRGGVVGGPAGDASERASEDVVRGAVAVELVHLGSLYHDDVIDEALTRRNVESVNARWGNLTAILAGDFLLARASELAAELGTEVAGLLAATIGRLCEGQVRELAQAFDTTRTEQAYFTAISGKTAALFATACRVGALTAGLPRADVEALTAYGDHFGMAFQIIDDVLDVVGSEERLGKPAGNDLREGVYTLPVIRALGEAACRTRLAGLLGRPLDQTAADRVRGIVGSNGVVAAAVEVAREYAAQAVAALAPLGDGPAVAALVTLGPALVDGVPAEAEAAASR